MTWGGQLPVRFQNGSVESQIDRLLDEAIQSVSKWSASWDPICNIFENPDGFTVHMALPGMEGNQIDVQVDNNVLRVNGKRKSGIPAEVRWYARSIPEGVFSCSFELPPYVDHEKSTASYRHGVLTVTLPKREKAKPRFIMVDCR